MSGNLPWKRAITAGDGPHLNWHCGVWNLNSCTTSPGVVSCLVCTTKCRTRNPEFPLWSPDFYSFLHWVNHATFAIEIPSVLGVVVGWWGGGGGMFQSSWGILLSYSWWATGHVHCDKLRSDLWILLDSFACVFPSQLTFNELGQESLGSV